MDGDERLREALLELEIIRSSESKAHEQSLALMACIQAFSSGAGPNEALARLLDAVNAALGAQLTAVLVPTAIDDVSSVSLPRSPDGDEIKQRLAGYQVLAVSDGSPIQTGETLMLPARLFRKPRVVADLQIAARVDSLADFGSALTMLLGPSDTNEAQVAASEGNRSVVLCLAAEKAAFSPQTLQLLRRLSALLTQALLRRNLQNQNALLAATIQGSSSGFAISDAMREDQPLIYVNAAFERLTGYRAEEVLGKNCRVLMAEPPDSPERVRLRKTAQALEQGSFLLRNRRKDGELFWNDLTLFPVYDAGGNVRNLVATQTDATERVEASQARDEARSKMEHALSLSSDAFLILGPDRTVLYATPALSTFFPAGEDGWQVGSRFEDNWAEFCAYSQEIWGRELSPEMRLADIGTLLVTLEGQEIQLPTGRTLFVRGTRLPDDTIFLSGTDVTPLKTAEALLRQRAAAIAAARDGIAIADAGDRLIYLNDTAAKLFGYNDVQRSVGRRWTKAYQNVPPEALESGQDLLLVPVRDPDHRHEIRVSPLGQEQKVLILRDVTQRLDQEERAAAMQASLARAEQQEQLGRMASGIAHDFNNLLSAITGSAALISMGSDLSEDTQAHADRITRAGSAAARLVNKLLEMGAGTGSGKGAEAAFDLRALLMDVPQIIAPALSKTVSVKTDLGEKPVLVKADKSDLMRIVSNLILNAADALGEVEGLVEISLRQETLDTAREARAGKLLAGRQYAQIIVRDTGMGIPDDILNRVLEPWFSTKGAHGTGLGLAMAAAMVRGAGGGLDILQPTGGGTEVVLWWPIWLPTEVLEQADAPGAPVSLTGARILIVDDEEDVANVLANYLGMLGAEVATCVDPAFAIELIEEDPSAFTALVTDYDMPGLSGGALIERTHKIVPDLPVFLVTALARRLSDPRVSPQQVNGIFAKPVDLEHLARHLAESALP